MLVAKRLCLPDCRAGGGRRGVGGVWIVRLPTSSRAAFTAKGVMPDSLQTLNTYVWQEWFPTAGKKRQANDMATLEVYSAGDPRSPDYESGIWVPLKEV